ncbi:hypothetical protein HDU76_007169, partial [Blyttiomyces sp. JEL0837]
NISNNYLTGIVPDTFSELHGEIDLTQNCLTGPPPPMDKEILRTYNGPHTVFYPQAACAPPDRVIPTYDGGDSKRKVAIISSSVVGVIAAVAVAVFFFVRDKWRRHKPVEELEMAPASSVINIFISNSAPHSSVS